MAPKGDRQKDYAAPRRARFTCINALAKLSKASGGAPGYRLQESPTRLARAAKRRTFN